MRTCSSSWQKSRGLPVSDVLKSYLVSRCLKCAFCVLTTFSTENHSTSFIIHVWFLIGYLKLEVSPVPETVTGCLSPELIPVKPVSEKNIRPVKEVLEFPSSEVYVPHSIYRYSFSLIHARMNCQAEIPNQSVNQ